MFFFNDTATTEIYTLSLHDALPISAHMHFMRRLTTELSGRARCRLPHAEPANNLLATRVRPTIVHSPLQRVVSLQPATSWARIHIYSGPSHKSRALLRISTCSTYRFPNNGHLWLDPPSNAPTDQVSHHILG